MMAELLDDKTKKQVKAVFAGLKSMVRMLFFTQENACTMCREQKKLLQELVSLSDKLKLEIFDFKKDTSEVLKYKVDKIPATVIIGDRDYGIRFFGVTGGYEFTSLLETIMMVSSGKVEIAPEVKKMIDEIARCQVLIVVAGMEGALPSIISGIVNIPVIGVPTSIGYGTNLGGIAPLLTMLNSCAPGLSVVNIDNGFGAGYLASLITR